MNFRSEIYYLNECIQLLSQLGTNETYPKFLAKKAALFCDNPDVFFSTKAQEISLLHTIEEQTKKALKNEWDTLMLYFGPIADGDHWDRLGRIVLLWDEFYHPELFEIDEYEQKLMDMDFSEYCEQFGHTLQGLDTTTRFSAEFENLTKPDDIIRYILKLELPYESQINIEDAFVNYKTHLSKIFPLIRKCADIMKKYESQLTEMVMNLKTYLENTVGDSDFLDFVKNKFESLDALPDNPLGYMISPEIFAPFQKGFSMSLDDDTYECNEPYFVPVGALYCDAYPLDYDRDEKAINNSSFYLDAIKLMSDKNRFEILTLIKDSEHFGNELATHLGLTTATVSHHVNRLQKKALVTQEQQGSRLYYHSNKQTIKECIDFLRRELL